MSPPAPASDRPADGAARPDTPPAVGAPDATREPLVQLDGLGIRYRLATRRRVKWTEMLKTGAGLRGARDLWALRGVDLQCHEGQALGVIGHNGAGKSTLCLVLAQILSPDEGRAAIRGKVSTLLRLDACFNRELSGRDNLELYGAFLGLGRHDLAGRVDEIIEFSELGEFIEEPVGHYSSGMRARLAFSVAATLEPDILLLDEILGVGDRAFRAKSERRIREMMEASRLIVIVSHAIGFLRGVCTHCLWLDHGQVKAYGPADEVLDAYEEHTGGKRATTWVEEDA